MMAPAPELAACILAAGAGRRIGGSKPLLPVNGRTFLEELLASFREAGVLQVWVVARPGLPALRELVAAAGARCVENPAPERGMLSSLQIVIEAILQAPTVDARREIDALFVAPVDCPRVAPATIRALARAYIETRAPIVVPRFAGRRGHPALFAAALFSELLAAPPDIGARAVVWAHSADRLEVDVSDPAVLEDIDTPCDWAAIQTVR